MDVVLILHNWHIHLQCFSHSSSFFLLCISQNKAQTINDIWFYSHPSHVYHVFIIYSIIYCWIHDRERIHTHGKMEELDLRYNLIDVCVYTYIVVIYIYAINFNRRSYTAASDHYWRAREACKFRGMRVSMLCVSMAVDDQPRSA